MLVKLSLLLAIRSLLLLIYEKKSVALKVIDGAFFCLYVGCAVFFFNADEFFSLGLQDLTVLAAASIIGVSLYYRLRKPYEMKPLWLLVKGLGFCSFLLLGSFWMMLRFSDDKVVMKITMTGNVKEEWVEWKNLRGPLMKAKLKAYEVKLDYPNGKHFTSEYLIGEVAAVRARVIRFHPIINILGLDNICQVDALLNGYMKPEDSQPLYATSLESMMWKFWETLFFGMKSSVFIKCATLESNYFPLIDEDRNPRRGSFYLTINKGGLSGILAK